MGGVDGVLHVHRCVIYNSADMLQPGMQLQKGVQNIWICFLPPLQLKKALLGPKRFAK